jgi:hypothetical protein
MNLKQRLGCAIRLRGHELKHRQVDGWVVSTCQRCGAVSELPVSAYSVHTLAACGDSGMGMPGAWIGVMEDIGSGVDIGCGDGGGGC